MLLLVLNHSGISHTDAKLRSLGECVRQSKVVADSPNMPMVAGLEIVSHLRRIITYL